MYARYWENRDIVPPTTFININVIIDVVGKFMGYII